MAKLRLLVKELSDSEISNKLRGLTVKVLWGFWGYRNPMKIPKFCGVLFWFQTEGTEKTPTEKTPKFSEKNSKRCVFLITLKVKNTR